MLFRSSCKASQSLLHQSIGIQPTVHFFRRNSFLLVDRELGLLENLKIVEERKQKFQE